MRLWISLGILLFSAATFADEEKVYTNADLERMFGKSKSTKSTKAATPKAPSTTQLPDPISWLNQRLAAEKEHREQVAAAEREIEATEQKLSEIADEIQETERLFRISTHLPVLQQLRQLRRDYQKMTLDLENQRKVLITLKQNRPYGPA